MDEILQKEYAKLVGRTIVLARELKPEEYELFDWDPMVNNPGLVLILDDGTFLIPSADPEGNAPGHLFVENEHSEE